MTPKEAFIEITEHYLHDEGNQFPNDDMQISKALKEECEVVNKAITELDELKNDVKRYFELNKIGSKGTFKEHMKLKESGETLVKMIIMINYKKHLK